MKVQIIMNPQKNPFHRTERIARITNPEFQYFYTTQAVLKSSWATNVEVSYKEGLIDSGFPGGWTNKAIKQKDIDRDITRQMVDAKNPAQADKAFKWKVKLDAIQNILEEYAAEYEITDLKDYPYDSQYIMFNISTNIYIKYKDVLYEKNK